MNKKSLFDWFFGEIHMDPSYGRNSPERPEPWNALVVNFVLCGWDLPKCYLADFTYGILDLSEAKLPYGSSTAAGGSRPSSGSSATSSLWATRPSVPRASNTRAGKARSSSRGRR